MIPSNFRDSVEKTVIRHFAALTKEPFTYKGVQFVPKKLTVSPMLLRKVQCPSGCGGCCRRFTLDWLPSEKETLVEQGYPLKRIKERVIPFNEGITVLSDWQEEEGYYCRHLQPKDGRCGIHKFSPYSCDFELIRLLFFSGDRPNQLTQKLFGRGWNMTRITDGEKGAMCWMEPPSKESIESVIRRMKRFKDWALHFGIDTWADEVISLVESGRLVHPVTFDPDRSKIGFGL